MDEVQRGKLKDVEADVLVERRVLYPKRLAVDVEEDGIPLAGGLGAEDNREEERDRHRRDQNDAPERGRVHVYFRQGAVVLRARERP